MSDHPDADKVVQIRAFALWTEHVAKLLDCSYADAAVFLAKLSPLVDLMRDQDFQEKLARFGKAVAEHPLPDVAMQSPPAKGVH